MPSPTLGAVWLILNVLSSLAAVGQKLFELGPWWETNDTNGPGIRVSFSFL